MSPRFYFYPQPREGPSIPYKSETQSLPVLRGNVLVIGATIVHSFGFIRDVLWRGAALNIARHIKLLDEYSPRYDPTVIPVLENGKNPESSEFSKLPAPVKRRDVDGYGYYTSADYHARYLSGELTPSAVINALMVLIERGPSPTKDSIAFLESQVDAIRVAAEASTLRYKNGQPLSPLDGVPVAVKDEVHVKGYKRMLGSRIDFKGQLDDTSWCVKKWEEAGAIVVGKTTMHELGLDTTNNNPNYGTPRNPHNEDYYCGGSSGGSAYAVAAGLVPIALGADGGGSIRIPSSFCGIWGLKPSHGRISGFPTLGLANTLGVYGPMACSIDDLALAYRIMATPALAEDDFRSALFPSPLASIPSSSTKAGKAKTLGLVSPWIDRAEPAVRAIFDASIEYYRIQQGYEVIDIDIPYLLEGQRAHALTILSEIASGLDQTRIRDLTPHNKVLVSIGGNSASSQDFIASQQMRGLLMSHLAHLFTRHPGLIIITPTTPIPGWKIEQGATDLAHGVADGKASLRNIEYAWLANFTGCPAISCPAGYVRETRIPVGIMGMSEWGSEEALIGFARDGEGILNVDIDASAASVTVIGQIPKVAATASTDAEPDAKKGARTPSGPGSRFADIIAEALSTG